MTCTADPEYIRAISVRYNRCPSGCSTRSAVSLTGFRLKTPQRPKTAVEIVPPSVRPRTAQQQREKTQLLEELMFFYGRGVHDSFKFRRYSTDFKNRNRHSLVSAWACQNEAFRQLYKASERQPRYRFFAQRTCLLPKVEQAPS